MTGGPAPDRGAAAHFSRAAQTYDLHARIQGRAAARLLGLLEGLPAPGFVIEVGCGTGGFTRELRRRWPPAELCAIDVAEGMVRAAGRAFASDQRVQFRLAAGESFRAGRPADLVTGNCSFHWLRPLAPALRHLAGQLAPGGRIACSLMLEGTLHELRTARLAAAPGKPPAGRLPTARETREALLAAGLVLERAEEEDLVETHEDVASLVRLLREQGLTGGEVSRAAVPLTRRELAGMRAEYESRWAAADGRIPATYRIGYYLGAKS